MATVNLLNYGWSYSKDSNVDVTIDTSPSEANTQVKFFIDSNDGSGNAKAYIRVDDISKYSSIYFNYKRISQYGVTSLWFGMFDSDTKDGESGTILFGDTGENVYSWSKNDANRGGSATLTIPSGVSGTKYIGFRFHGNGNPGIPDKDGGITTGSAKESIYINSLTATERGYTLTYNANGGFGGPASVSDVTSATISSTVPTRDGYDFLGWSTYRYATSASYVAGDSISLTSDTTLYAVWKKVTYTITYDANGGSNAPSSQQKIHDEDLTLTTSKPIPPPMQYYTHTIFFDANGGICDTDFIDVIDSEEFKFGYWEANIDGGVDIYRPGDTYSKNNDMILSAHYLSTYINEGTVLPTATRENYDFLGWATDPYAESGIIGSYNPDNSVTLYAIWKIRGQVYICDNTGEFSPYMIFIYDGSDWNQYVPYIYTESGWEIYSG